ncbi:sugar phosphate isomerase/epimerase family protein [Brevibacillus sp. NPDC003359]|uniref:sugar phosphate isomerase/epimerase family protein n=1 Tax=unclassified Brevibacillus TaxID=2684853 RepID=UPI0036B191C3
MKLSLCTISFRHQLISFAQIVRFAHRHHFDGIELWGIHAQHLYDHDRVEVEEQLQLLKAQGMSITMLSDYLDIATSSGFARLLEKAKRLIALAKWLNVKQIRTFAGQKASKDVGPDERVRYVHHLQILCEMCQEHGIQLLVETHPNTLTDQMSSTLALLQEVNHPALKVNLDFLHVWESGADPLDSYDQLKPWVAHYHLKNIISSDHLPVFAPHNVYAPNGDREGMVPLSEGVVDYGPIVEKIADTDLFASIEWFGHSPQRVLVDEVEWLRKAMMLVRK